MSEPNYAGQDLEALAEIPNYQNWILGHFRPYLHGRVLEIGAGVGTLAAMYRDAVDSAVLLEPAPNLADRLRAKFAGDRGVTTIHERLEDARDSGKVADRSFDAVVLINVLEHIDDDAHMLDDIHHVLAPDGMLLLFVPALPWLFGSLDSLVGHRRRYLKPELRALIERAGFDVREIRYFDALGVLPWWVTGRVIKARAFDERAARIYDKVGVPLGSLAERFVTPPIGKNLLCVAQRRSRE